MQVLVHTPLSSYEYDGYDGSGNDALQRWAMPGSPTIALTSLLSSYLPRLCALTR